MSVEELIKELNKIKNKKLPVIVYDNYDSNYGLLPQLASIVDEFENKIVIRSIE